MEAWTATLIPEWADRLLRFDTEKSVYAVSEGLEPCFGFVLYRISPMAAIR